MILGAELFERMTTLGIAVNLVPYMTGTMHLGSAAAANTVTNFIGTSFMLCLLGGFVADTYLGPLPHHRRLLRRPSHRCDGTDDLDGCAGAAAGGVRGRDGAEP
ncbi:Nitrate/chlorate transporter [Hordeum vulgare]|nr:Nitrate/chlorate transporter [Hordeum vulgare]